MINSFEVWNYYFKFIYLYLLVVLFFKWYNYSF